MFIFYKEPLSRGNGPKPHVCEELIRMGGEQVFAHWAYAPQGILNDKYTDFIQDHPDRKNGWRIMRRNPKTYARGQIRHKDHKNLYLDIWHRVIMNRENESWSLRMLLFLD